MKLRWPRNSYPPPPPRLPPERRGEHRWDYDMPGQFKYTEDGWVRIIQVKDTGGLLQYIPMEENP